VTNPATETKSIGLQADAQVVMVFARHLDYFIVTRKSCPLIGTTPFGQFHHDTKRSSTYRDFAKTHANPDTPRYRSGQAHGNSLNVRQEVAYYNCLTCNYLQINSLDDQTLCSITSSLRTHAYRVTGLCEAVPTI
jgi:gamma-glutamyl-gamma-aminobutyrate hydrolase PuuD